MIEQNLRELFYSDLDAYIKTMMPDPQGYIKDIYTALEEREKAIRFQILAKTEPVPRVKKEKPPKPPKEKPAPKIDLRPVIVSTLKQNEKYCQTCNEKFISNGWTLTCPFCAANSMGLHDRIELLDRDNFTCIYCKKTLDDGMILHIDHIVPVALGGEDIASNLVTACRSCNCRKHDLPLSPELQRSIENTVRLRNEEYGIDPKRVMVIGLADAEERRSRLRGKPTETP